MAPPQDGPLVEGDSRDGAPLLAGNDLAVLEGVEAQVGYQAEVRANVSVRHAGSLDEHDADGSRPEAPHPLLRPGGIEPVVGSVREGVAGPGTTGDRNGRRAADNPWRIRGAREGCGPGPLGKECAGLGKVRRARVPGSG